jgi:hypothetical protein
MEITLTSLTHRVMALLVSVWMVVLGTTDAHAQNGRRLSDLNLVPTVTDIVLEDGQLLASGTITATVRGREITSEFSDIPVDISIAEDQTGAGECPILDLEIFSTGWTYHHSRSRSCSQAWKTF